MGKKTTGYTGRFGTTDIGQWIKCVFINKMACAIADKISTSISEAISEAFEDLSVTIEGKVEVPKFGMSTEEWCNANGIKCQITKCIVVDKEGVATYSYHDSLTQQEYTGDQFLVLGYEKCEDVKGKKFEIRGEYYLIADENIPIQKRKIYCIDGWFDYDNQVWCYVLSGEVPNQDGSNLLNISNYKMNFGDLQGVSNPEEDFVLETSKGQFDIGNKAEAPLVLTNAELAPLFADELADHTAKNPPEAGYEWAILGYKIGQHRGKKYIIDDISGERCLVSNNEQIEYTFNTNDSLLTPGQGSLVPLVKSIGKPDACGCLDDRSCLIADGDAEITVLTNQGLRVCALFVCVVTEA